MPFPESKGQKEAIESPEEFIERVYSDLVEQLTINGRNLTKYDDIDRIVEIFCQFIDREQVAGKITEKTEETNQGEGTKTCIYFDNVLIMEIDIWDNEVDSVQISDDLHELVRRLATNKE
ncbi:MAG: hypothetical protein WC734_01595 [Patescibacteria group bacterium]